MATPSRDHIEGFFHGMAHCLALIAADKSKKSHAETIRREALELLMRWETSRPGDFNGCARGRHSVLDSRIAILKGITNDCHNEGDAIACELLDDLIRHLQSNADFQRDAVVTPVFFDDQPIWVGL